MPPILLFEVAWKVLWIAVMAILHLVVADDMNAGIREVLFSCSFIVIIIAVIPGGYVRRRYVRALENAWQ
jgi:hypothetical protein